VKVLRPFGKTNALDLQKSFDRKSSDGLRVGYLSNGKANSAELLQARTPGGPQI
jgi:hypothetical protein